MSSTVIILAIVVILIATIAVTLYFAFFRKSNTLSMDIGGVAPQASGGSDSSTEKVSKNRVNGMGVLVAAAMGALLAKLWSMQLVSSDTYSSQAESNRTRTISTLAPRGRILDRNGTELVKNRSSLTVVAESSVIDDEIETRLLANVLGMPYMAVRRKIQNQSEGAQSSRTVCVDVSRRIVAVLGEHATLFNGVSVEERTQRAYPNGSLGAHVLGYTSTITESQLEASKNDTSDGAVSYESGDTVGQAGVEYQYESVLQGVRGEQTVYVDASGNVTEYTTSVPSESGSDIMLTIDSNIQRGAEEGLAHAIEVSRSSGNAQCVAGAVVVLDCTNGEILALASAPTFNPSQFIGGISNDDWENLSAKESSYPLLNRAVSGQYMAASTIKPLTTFAALDGGVADPTTAFYCSGFWTGFGDAYGMYCWNHNGHGGMDLQSGITYSCDVVFYEIGKAFFYSDKPEFLQETFRKWGLGSITGIDLPSEATGRVPDADWKWNYFSSYPDSDRKWQGGDMANISIGQGDILVTPLQMACAYMGIANNGKMYRPHVFKSVASSTAKGTVIDHKNEIYLTPEESQANYELVHQALHDVIYVEDATMASHFTNLSVTVAGKTGSGERTGEEATGWFCCYAPFENPKYVIAAVVEQGGYGATSAMYAVRDTLGAIYNEPDDAANVSTALN